VKSVGGSHRRFGAIEAIHNLDRQDLHWYKSRKFVTEAIQN
jgi:hypothetical protein